MTILALELLEAIRDRLDDTGGDTGAPDSGYYTRWQEDDRGCLWKNRELVRYLNLTLRELGQRRPLKDRSGYPLTLKAGQRSYELEPEIVRIEAVNRVSDGEPLVKVTVAEMQTVTRWNRHHRELLHQDWRTETGWPTHYLLDEQQGFLTVYPTPILGFVDALRRQVWRSYLDEVSWTAISHEATPSIELAEVPDHYFDALMAGVCARAYQKRDADAYSPKLAAEAAMEFDRRVGPAVSLQHLENEARWADMPGDFTPRTYIAR